jgi:hypothetical protein
MNRYTFVIQVHDDGPSTLENLSTHELISLRDLAAAGPQIECWLAALHGGEPTEVTRPDRAPPPARAPG